MSKIRSNFLPFVVVGLIATSFPVHAGNSFLDSMNEKLKKVTNDVKDQIKVYYGDETIPGSLPTQPPVQVVVPPPRVITVDPIREKFAPCRRFLGYKYDSNYIADSKKLATIYLNASLDIFELTFDAEKISSKEMDERNKCIELALEHGADPDSSGVTYDAPTPLARAVRNKNQTAVKMLLDHKADPNIGDNSIGKSIPLLNIAIQNNSQPIALNLINAGADLTTPNLLWIAAANAADQIVDQLIESKIIPVNQVYRFSDYTDEVGQTALDASESRIYALNKYKKKITQDSQLSVQDKLFEANGVLYYHYPLTPQLRMKDGLDPDFFMTDLMNRQQRVSQSLKAAGWTCNEDNCGIIDFSND